MTIDYLQLLDSHFLDNNSILKSSISIHSVRFLSVTIPRARRVRGHDTRPTAHEAFIDDAGDDAEEQHPLSDEEDDTRTKEKMKIIAQDGQLGFSHPKKGFDSRTNFTVDIHGDIFSVEYQLKGTNFCFCISNLIFTILLQGAFSMYGYLMEKF